MADRHLSWPERAFKWLNVNRVSRMHKHYLAIRDEISPKTEAERKEVKYFKKKFVHYHKRTAVLLKLRLLLSVFLYASVIVNLLKTIPWLAFLVDFIQFGKALVGTTVLIVVVFWVTSRINLHLELMNESLTHLIAIYHKNNGRDTDRVLRKLSKTL